MSLYTYQKVVNPAKLHMEIGLAGLPIGYVETSGVNVNIDCTADLTEEQVTTLGAVVEAHIPVTTEEVVRKRLSDAMNFGRQMILEFGVENVMLGVSTNQIKSIVMKTASVQALLTSGALYTAIEAIEAITPDEVLTQARINSFSNKIRVYLGMPLV